MPWIWNGAATIAPIGCRGLSEPYGSWKTICTSRRSRRSSSPATLVTSRPSNSMVPAVGSSSRRMVRPAVDFPQPDSPTTPSVSPESRVRLSPSTAFTGAPWVRMSFWL